MFSIKVALGLLLVDEDGELRGPVVQSQRGKRIDEEGRWQPEG